MKIFLLISLFVMSACSGGNTSDCCGNDTGDNNPNANNCTIAGNWTVDLESNDTASVLTTATQTYRIEASGPNKISYYILTESNEAPLASDAGWLTLPATGTSIVNESAGYTINPATDGEKTVYLWLKDDCNGVSPSDSVTFVLDVDSPTGSVLIDNRAKLTLISDLTVDVSVNAQDANGIQAYAITLDPMEPNESSSEWIPVSTTDLSVNTTVTFNSGITAQSVYVWIRDVGGHVQQLSDDIEIMQFQSTGLGNDLGQYSSITVDSLDNPYMSFYDAVVKRMGYAYFHSDGTIDPDVVDQAGGGDLGKGTSIAADSNGKLHIAYRDVGNGKLKYSTNASGSWVATTIEDGGFIPSIVIDSNNKAHITHNNGPNVRYVTNVNGAWFSQTIYNSASIASSLVLDDNDSAHIVIPSNSATDLDYLTNASGSWQTERIFDSVVTTVDNPALAIDSNGKIFTAHYMSSGSYFVNLFDNLSGEWISTNIGNENVTQISMAFDSNDHLHIVYYDSIAKNLVYATNYSGNWSSMIVDSADEVGSYCDIAIDSNDRLHISYYDATNADLKYATTADAP